ncbi:MAG TPA: hypothetical protein DCQ98_13380 [Planctomycetaceae bacterium]|nr:hypothetical protein [Planctomycetaceae bacterium]
MVLACLLLSASPGCGMFAGSNNVQGKRLFQSGQYDQAIASFQQALQRDPTNADACYNLATTYHHLGMATRNTSLVTQAESLYNQALDRDPNHVDAHRGLAVLLVQDERKESAFTLLRRWNAASPLSAEPKVELARLYREFGDDKTASELLAEAIKQDPRNVRAFRAMGLIREEQGELASALESYQRALMVNGMQPDLAPKIAALQQRVAMGGLVDPATRTALGSTLPAGATTTPGSSAMTNGSATAPAGAPAVNSGGRY